MGHLRLSSQVAELDPVLGQAARGGLRMLLVMAAWLRWGLAMAGGSMTFIDL